MNRSSFTAALVLAAAASAQWHPSTPATSPGLRVFAGMTYDATRGHTLLFGGAQTMFGNFNDTWRFDGTTWTQFAPTVSPSARPGIALACDTLRGVVVMYGGGNTSFFGGPSVDETWEWNGSTWTMVTTTTTPGGLGGYGIAYDSARNRTVLYGGVANSFFPIAAGDTWEYDGIDWAQVTTAASPGPLEYPAMCFDSGNSRTLLFGGIDPQIGGNSTMWAFNGTNWTALTVAGAVPPARSRAQLVYDAARAVCILHGGADPMTGAAMNDTWEFDGTGWIDVTAAGAAMAQRYGHGMAFDAGRRQAVVFGGVDQNFNGATGTWQYGAAYEPFGAGCVGSGGVPALASATAPRLGSTFSSTLSSLAPGAAFAAVVTGLSKTTSALGALPVDLSVLGMPGCALHVSTDVVTFLPVTGGVATWNLALPNTASFVGTRFHQQGLSLDAGLNAAGAAASNAATAIVGR